MATVIH